MASRGIDARGLCSWRKREATSLPEPEGPAISTVPWLSAMRCSRPFSSTITGPSPMSACRRPASAPPAGALAAFRIWFSRTRAA
ncbi:MAG: hypothetical protein ACYTJ0_17540 [Planctomycetota bacterium]|jgi:hypothetical protein